MQIKSFYCKGADAIRYCSKDNVAGIDFSAPCFNTIILLLKKLHLKKFQIYLYAAIGYSYGGTGGGGGRTETAKPQIGRTMLNGYGAIVYHIITFSSRARHARHLGRSPLICQPLAALSFFVVYICIYTLSACLCIYRNTGMDFAESGQTEIACTEIGPKLVARINFRRTSRV